MQKNSFVKHPLLDWDTLFILNSLEKHEGLRYNEMVEKIKEELGSTEYMIRTRIHTLKVLEVVTVEAIIDHRNYHHKMVYRLTGFGRELVTKLDIEGMMNKIKTIEREFNAIREISEPDRLVTKIG